MILINWEPVVAQLGKNLSAVKRPRFDSLVRNIHWRRDSLPTLVFWPGEFHGLYSAWGCKELGMTERLSYTTGSKASKVWYKVK